MSEKENKEIYEKLRKLIWGPQVREEILKVAPIFLDPSKAKNSDEAFHALIVVFVAYSLGSRTAQSLIMEKKKRDPNWIPPTKEMAIEIVQQLYKIKQYLPYILSLKQYDVNYIYNTIVTTQKDNENKEKIRVIYPWDRVIKRQQTKTQIGYVIKSPQQPKEESKKEKIKPIPIYIIDNTKRDKKK